MPSDSPRTPRLGDILIARGYCTARQIEEALDEQVVYDGRLGTNLLELGIVTEEQLARALAIQFGRPARWGPVAVEKAALACMPAASAERWQAVPLRLEGRCLEVLVCELRDPTRLDDMAFALGKEIRPVLVTETRLWELLRRYYGVPSPERRGRSGHRGEEGGIASHQEILADLQTRTGRYVTPIPAATPTAGSAVPGSARAHTAAGSVVPRAVTPTQARATPVPSRPAVPPVLTRVTPAPSSAAVPAATRVMAAVPPAAAPAAPAAPVCAGAPDAAPGEQPARTRVMPTFAPPGSAAGPVASRATPPPPPLPRTPPPPPSRAATLAAPGPASGVLPSAPFAAPPRGGFEPAVDTDPGIVADLQAYAARQLRGLPGASPEVRVAPGAGTAPQTTAPRQR